MERSTELRLPTVAVPVRLALVGLDPIEAELFLADIPRRGRSELVDDIAALLDAGASFLPVRGPRGVRLLNKHAIAWVAISRRDARTATTDFAGEEPSEVFTLYDRQHHVEVELAVGVPVVGTMLDSSPADRPRVIDHLNRSAHFVRLWTVDDHYLINKRQIVAVVELPERA